MTNLKQFREAANLTQKAIAEALGTTQQTYQRWEKGTAKPPIDALQSLAILFKVPLHAILGTPDATKLAFDAHNTIITGDDTAFWGHLGLQFPGESQSHWYPISAQESNRISAILSSYDDPVAAVACSTLNNRILAFRPTAMTRVWLLDEACDEPDGESYFTIPPKREYDDGNGLPSSFYQAITAAILCDEDEMERLGPTLMGQAEEVIAKDGLSVNEKYDLFIATRFHMNGGSVLKIQPSEVGLCDLIVNFEYAASSLFLEIEDVRDEAWHYIPRQNIVLIDAPKTLFERGEEAIASELS